MTGAGVVVSVGEPGWRHCGVDLGRIRAAARLALARGRTEKTHAERGRLTVLLADDDRLRELNLRFRGKNYPTNVLSFPASENAGDYLGDVALALGVAAREAGDAGKRLVDHVVHLTVHGVLHLLGYDHRKAGEARNMERLEIAILHELGVANPYTSRP